MFGLIKKHILGLLNQPLAQIKTLTSQHFYLYVVGHLWVDLLLLFWNLINIIKDCVAIHLWLIHINVLGTLILLIMYPVEYMFKTK